MDVIDFLIKNQKMLIDELKEVGTRLGEPDLYFKVKKYVSNFDLYETVENNVFAAVGKMRGNGLLEALAEGCGKANGKIWFLLDNLVRASLSKEPHEIRRTYEELKNYLEMHFQRTRILLPMVQAWTHGSRVMQHLGEDAIRFYARFYEPVVRVEDVLRFVTRNKFDGLDFDRPLSTVR